MVPIDFWSLWRKKFSSYVRPKFFSLDHSVFRSFYGSKPRTFFSKSYDMASGNYWLFITHSRYKFKKDRSPLIISFGFTTWAQRRTSLFLWMPFTSGKISMECRSFIFLPVLYGWKVFNSLSKKVIWKVYVIYQIWIGKYWFDHTASLYHLMESNSDKRSGFFPKKILPYLPSWTDPNLSWKDLLNWIWIGIFLLPILILSYLWVRNNRKSPKV